MKKIYIITSCLLIGVASHALQPSGEKLIDTFGTTKNYHLDSILSRQQPRTEIDDLEEAYYDWMMQNMQVGLSSADTTAVTDTTIFTDIRNTPDSVIKLRLQALPNEMAMTYNHIVRSFIMRYLVKIPHFVARMDYLSKYYFPIFEDALSRHQLPLELKYLAVIESALNPMAHSRMGAAGLWQFMPSTGKLFNLEINSLVDERRDVIKSTEAACLYLARLYDLFGEWNLAIAAYNCGPGNVLKAMRRSGKKEFWDIYVFLPRETRAYVPIFVAANYAMNYYQKHGIQPTYVEKFSIATDTIVTTQRQHFEQISALLDISIQELRQLNPQYVKDIIPGYAKYAIVLPSDKMDKYLVQQDTILAYRADELIHNRKAEIDLAQKTSPKGGYTVNGVTYYKVRSGDTLSGIAQKFRCTIKQLQTWNGLKSTTIRVGQTLKIKK